MPAIAPCPPRSATGFTLVEMAVVLVIVGVVALTVFPAMTALRAATQRAATQSNLQSLMRATAAYVQANGCLPCPTPATAIGAGFGNVRGDASAAPVACGECKVAEGIPPYMALGVSAATAHDGWGHWFSMRVDPALTVAFGVVPPFAGCSSSDVAAGTCTSAQLGLSVKGMCKTGLATANRIAVQTPGGATQPAAVLFASHGSKGYGAYIAAATSLADNNGCRLQFPSLAEGCPQALACSGTTGLAAAMCNASGSLRFVDAAMSADYDGLLAYADRNSLVSAFGTGACQAVW